MHSVCIIFAEDKLHLSKDCKQARIYAFGLHYLCKRKENDNNNLKT